MEALGRRWVALGLGWMPGMMATDGRRFASKPAPKLLSDGTLAEAAWMADSDCKLRLVLVAGLVPDFTDTVTELALLHFVQLAWAGPVYVLPLSGLHTAGRWAVVGNPPAGVLERMAAEGYPTWAEACIAALEAAKEVTT